MFDLPDQNPAFVARLDQDMAEYDNAFNQIAFTADTVYHQNGDSATTSYVFTMEAILTYLRSEDEPQDHRYRKIAALVASAVNATIRYEHSLQELEDRYNTLADAARDTIATIDTITGNGSK
jgi:hypothetical protein